MRGYGLGIVGMALLALSACVTVDVIAPKFVRPGKTFEATLTARSNDGGTASEVTVCAALPSGFELAGVRATGEAGAGPVPLNLSRADDAKVAEKLGAERGFQCWESKGTAIVRGTVTFEIAVAKGTPEGATTLSWALYTDSTSGSYTTQHVIQKKKDKSGATAPFAEDSLF